MGVNLLIKLHIFKVSKLTIWYMYVLGTLVDTGDLNVQNKDTVSALVVQMTHNAQKI